MTRVVRVAAPFAAAHIFAPHSLWFEHCNDMYATAAPRYADAL